MSPTPADRNVQQSVNDEWHNDDTISITVGTMVWMMYIDNFDYDHRDVELVKFQGCGWLK